MVPTRCPPISIMNMRPGTDSWRRRGRRIVLQLLHSCDQGLGRDAGLRAKILAQGIVPRNVGLGDFDAHIRREMDRLDPLLKSIGARSATECAPPGAADGRGQAPVRMRHDAHANLSAFIVMRPPFLEKP